MENPIKMGWFRGKTSIFGNIHILNSMGFLANCFALPLPGALGKVVPPWSSWGALAAWERYVCISLFPTCQVRVVRFYVSLLFSFSSSSSPPSSSSSINWDPLSSVWRAGPQWQLGSSEFSVACWTSTAILWVQCGVLDSNRDAVSSVWRAGPQPRCSEFSVACWTPTAILRVQCGVLDPNRDPASAVWRAGPQPRSCECSVACRTPTAILRIQCGVPDPNRDPASSVWRPGPQPRSCEFSVACRTSSIVSFFLDIWNIWTVYYIHVLIYVLL